MPAIDGGPQEDPRWNEHKEVPMQVTVKQIAGPQSYEWEDIPNGTAAQLVDNPNNIVLKVSQDTAIRLTTYNNGVVGSSQHPGSQSRWYKCGLEMTITPVVGIKQG